MTMVFMFAGVCAIMVAAMYCPQCKCDIDPGSGREVLRRGRIVLGVLLFAPVLVCIYALIGDFSGFFALLLGLGTIGCGLVGGLVLNSAGAAPLRLVCATCRTTLLYGNRFVPTQEQLAVEIPEPEQIVVMPEEELSLTTPDRTEIEYVGSKNSRVVHYPDCSWVHRINEANRINYEAPPQNKRLHKGCPTKQAFATE